MESKASRDAMIRVEAVILFNFLPFTVNVAEAPDYKSQRPGFGLRQGARSWLDGLLLCPHGAMASNQIYKISFNWPV